MDWATASTSSSERSARNVTSNPCSSWSAGSWWPPLAAKLSGCCWESSSTAIVFTALSWLGGIFWWYGIAVGCPAADRVELTATLLSSIPSRPIAGGQARDRGSCPQPWKPLSAAGAWSACSGCAELRSLAGQRLDPAPVARGHGVLRGDPRAADAGDIGQGEKVRGPG